jgi:hypothetical protein
VGAEYQDPDWRVADYQLFQLDPEIFDPTRNTPLVIRGPRPPSLRKGEYFVCLGAAQTFGRFCAKPFPTLLEQRLGLPVLNISHGGAGPCFFTQSNERLLGYLNNARFVVVQVMSGRSEGNSLFECRGVGHYTRRSDGVQIGCDQAFAELLQTESEATVKRLVAETRDNWLASYRQILSNVTAPVILFWFSTRQPKYRQTFESVAGLFGEFPQLVNETMVRALRDECDHFASCTSRRGVPQRLVDRFNGEPVSVTDPWAPEPWTHNWYYPTPETHEDAATALEAPCRKVAGIPAARRWRWF